MQSSREGERAANDISKDAMSPTGSGKHWLWEIFCLLICLYTLAVIFGYVASTNRLSPSEIALVAIVAIGTLLKVSPQWLDKLAKVKVGSLEFELTKVQREVSRVGGDRTRGALNRASTQVSRSH